MSKQRPLALLIELERRMRDGVAAVAARARHDADAAGSTLQMLRGYRLDYDTRSPKRGAATFTPTAVHVHEAFTGKLDRAIGEQGRLAERLAALRDERERALADRQRRLKALETLQQRRDDSARERVERAEQRQTDEFALQSYLRSKSKGRGNG